VVRRAYISRPLLSGPRSVTGRWVRVKYDGYAHRRGETEPHNGVRVAFADLLAEASVVRQGGDGTAAR
jgi:hypothetical protein